jgi:hypothetical protein
MMRLKIQLTIIIGIFLTALSFVKAGAHSNPVFEVCGKSTAAFDNIGSDPLNQDEELEEFYAAKKHVYDSNYSVAITEFEKFLDKFPFGRLRDEAYYWSAYALNKLSLAQEHTYVMAKIKEQAFDYLNRLIQEHPASSWADDASVLRMEIASELILMGKDAYLQYIEETLSTKNNWSSDLKLHALDSLMRVRKEAAMPILLKLVEDEKDPEVRKKAVFLLGKHFDQEAIDTLEKVAEHDNNEEIRKEASLWLNQIEMKLMPVQLKTYVFGGRIKEGYQLKQMPENQLTTFSLPSPTPRTKEEMVGIIEVFFDNELDIDPEVSRIMTNINIKIDRDKMRSTQPLRSGQSLSIEHGIPLQNFDVSFVANEFLVRVLNREVVKEPERISGKVLFQDLNNDKKHYAAFAVDEKSDQLIAICRGNEMAMIVIQFEPTRKLAKTTRLRLGQPIYRTVFTNVYGTETKVYSSRAAWPGNEMSLTADTTDFGQAKAEIPGREGTWILEGYITLNKKEMNFLARLAKLADPEGNTAAQADEIIVPLTKPEDYRVLEKKKD